MTCMKGIHPDTSTVMCMVLPWFMEQDTIMHPGMEPTIIQDHGHGDSISLIHHTMAGDLAGDSAGVILKAGLV